MEKERNLLCYWFFYFYVFLRSKILGCNTSIVTVISMLYDSVTHESVILGYFGYFAITIIWIVCSKSVIFYMEEQICRLQIRFRWNFKSYFIYIVASEKIHWQEIVFHTSSMNYWLLSTKSFYTVLMVGKCGLQEELFSANRLVLLYWFL